MGKHLAAIVAALLGAVLLLSAAFVLDESAHAAQRVTRPTVHYTMHFNQPGNACEAERFCWETIRIDQNPANKSVRAWDICTDGSIHLGSWHTGVGTTSNTSSCATGQGIQSGGFDWDRSAPRRVTCYTFPSPVSEGECGG